MVFIQELPKVELYYLCRQKLSRMKREVYESQKAFAGEKGTIDAAALCGARQHRADDLYDDARKIGEKGVS